MSTQTWDEQVLARIAAEIRRLRKAQKMSAQKLSDRTAELGHTVSRATVADLEIGRRKYITVTELLLLAAALNTTPAALVYPGPRAEQVEVIPNAILSEETAAQWFGGNLRIAPDWADSDAYDTNMERIGPEMGPAQRLIKARLEELRGNAARTTQLIEMLTDEASHGDA